MRSLKRILAWAFMATLVIGGGVAFIVAVVVGCVQSQLFRELVLFLLLIPAVVGLWMLGLWAWYTITDG
jgi:hypothetical protein